MRGFATGAIAIGDVRRTYTTSTARIPACSADWRAWNHCSPFTCTSASPLIAQRNAECASRSLLPADGFDVTVFQASQLNDPRPTAWPSQIRSATGSQRCQPARRHQPFWPAGPAPCLLAEEMADEAVMAARSARLSPTPSTGSLSRWTWAWPSGSTPSARTCWSGASTRGFDSATPSDVQRPGPDTSDIRSRCDCGSRQRSAPQLMPYLEYGGSLGANCLWPAPATSKSAGTTRAPPSAPHRRSSSRASMPAMARRPRTPTLTSGGLRTSPPTRPTPTR